MRRVDRYVLTEMTIPALVGVVVLLILLLGNSLYMLLRWLYSGANPHDIGQILLYSLPGLVLQAVPGALLLGTALALNRLERDRELLSMRLAGVRLVRVVWPFILLGLLVSVALFIFQEKVTPETTKQATRLTQKMMYGSPTLAVQPDVMFKVGNNYLYARQVDTVTQTLYDVIIVQLEPNGTKWVTVPMAENHNGLWLFRNSPYTNRPPQFYMINRKGDITMYGEASAEDSLLNMQENHDLWTYMSEQPSTPDAMTLRELRTLQQSIRGPQVGYFGTGNLDPKKLTFYFNRRFAIPLSALVAVLMGIPFAVRFGRSGSYVGLLCSVILCFFFVIAGQWTQVLVESRNLNPIFGAWAPDAFFGLMGLIFLIREERA